MAEEQRTVKVEIASGKMVTVSGDVAKVILFLAEYEKFFNDKRTVGNFILMAKQGHVETKNDMTLQAN